MEIMGYDIIAASPTHLYKQLLMGMMQYPNYTLLYLSIWKLHPNMFIKVLEAMVSDEMIPTSINMISIFGNDQTIRQY